jgi:hypothetical protein
MNKWFYRVWTKGKYLDLWSVNHTLAGSVIAWPLYKWEVPWVYNFIIAMVLIVGWEVYEITHDIEETWQNRSTDIITGIIGFVFISSYLVKLGDTVQYWIYFWILGVWLILEIWGYVAYKIGKVR